MKSGHAYMAPSELCRKSYLWKLWAEPLKCVAPASWSDGPPWQDSLVFRLRDPDGFLCFPYQEGRRGALVSASAFRG